MSERPVSDRTTRIFQAVVGAGAEVPRFFLAYIVDVWNRVNATTFRITMTMWVVLTTSIRYQMSGIEIGRGWIKFGAWTPSDSWLTFLAVMAGVDVAQFAAKRFSTKPELMSTSAKTEVTETPGGTVTATREEVSTGGKNGG
jgi:hypothetical protein